MEVRLFEFAIILQPKVSKDGDVTEEAALVDSGKFLARDQEQATLLAGRKIPDDKLDRLDRLTIVVRPF